MAALLVSGLAAVLGVRAATIHIRDNIDEFMNDLHKQGLQQLLFTASTYDFP